VGLAGEPPNALRAPLQPPAKRLQLSGDAPDAPKADAVATTRGKRCHVAVQLIPRGGIVAQPVCRRIDRLCLHTAAPADRQLFRGVAQLRRTKIVVL
jgi:hypothetical protein